MSSGKAEMAKLSDILIGQQQPATIINFSASRWSRVRLCVCAMIFTIILALVAFAAVKYHPRQVTGTIESFALDSKKPYTFAEGGIIDTNWRARVKIDNPNPWGVQIDAMRISMYMQHDRREPLAIAHFNDVYLASMKTAAIEFDVSVPLRVTGGALPALLDECLDKKEASIHFDIDVDLHLTHWTGKWFHLEVDRIVPCVLPDSLLSSEPVAALRLLADLF